MKVIGAAIVRKMPYCQNQHDGSTDIGTLSVAKHARRQASPYSVLDSKDVTGSIHAPDQVICRTPSDFHACSKTL
jgi:hypothetical protein